MKHKIPGFILFFTVIILATLSCTRESYNEPIDQLLIVFVSARNGDYSIYSMKPSGADVKRLSDPSSDCVLKQCFDTYPTACKDNIAFSSDRTGRFQIYTMSTDGTNLIQLTNSSDADLDAPDYSNDCNSLSYTRAYNIKRQLQIMNLKTGYVTQVTYDDGSGACCGKFSPDDTTIAYLHDPFPGLATIPGIEKPMSIYTISADGSNKQWLCHTSNVVPPLSWSPNGKTIIFLMSSPATGHLQIFSMPVDCSEPPKPLSNPSYDTFDPAFSPDGNEIAYVSNQYGNSRIFLMNADGSNAREITNDVHLNDQPTWQKGIILPAR